MKMLLKNLLERSFPSLLHRVQASRQRKYFRERFELFQIVTKSQLFDENETISVLSGPFKGMLYLDEMVWGSITPKWIGSYEAELHEPLLQLVDKPVDTIIDVGCAEGYYAVGTAIIKPEANIFAFDVDPISRSQTLHLAGINGVADRVHVEHFCSHKDLDRLSKPGVTLVICDIEGAEVNLLDPEKALSLRFSHILVEVHEIAQKNHEVETLLKNRFMNTHDITTITASSREKWVEQHMSIFPEISKEDLLEAASEHRNNGQTWLSMRVK